MASLNSSSKGNLALAEECAGLLNATIQGICNSADVLVPASQGQMDGNGCDSERYRAGLREKMLELALRQKSRGPDSHGAAPPSYPLSACISRRGCM